MPLRPPRALRLGVRSLFVRVSSVFHPWPVNIEPPKPVRVLTAGYANRQSGQFERLVTLWVQLPLRSLEIDPVVQRRRRLRDMQESAGSIPAGITWNADCEMRIADCHPLQSAFRNPRSAIERLGRAGGLEVRGLCRGLERDRRSPFLSLVRHRAVKAR